MAASLLALLVIYVGATFLQVWSGSKRDDAGPADAAIVLGAAQYDGRPSPVLGARLDRAFELHDAGLVSVIIVTGGRQQGDRTTEAKSSYDYLRVAGVPDESLLLEVDGRSTWESLAASTRIVRNRGLSDVLLVSDPYHTKRLEGIAGELGLEAKVAPTDGPVMFRNLVRETAAVSVGRLVGYRRLRRLSGD